MRVSETVGGQEQTGLLNRPDQGPDLEGITRILPGGRPSRVRDIKDPYGYKEGDQDGQERGPPTMCAGTFQNGGMRGRFWGGQNSVMVSFCPSGVKNGVMGLYFVNEAC